MQEYSLIQSILFAHFSHYSKQILIFNFYLGALSFSFGRSVGIGLPFFSF